MTDDLSARLRRLERNIDDVPALRSQDISYDTRVPSVIALKSISSSISARLTKVAILWISPADLDVAKYEVWVSNTSGSSQPYLAASVTDSPASFNVTSDAAGNAIAFVRTVLRSGLSTPLTAAPSVTFQTF